MTHATYLALAYGLGAGALALEVALLWRRWQGVRRSMRGPRA